MESRGQEVPGAGRLRRFLRTHAVDHGRDGPLEQRHQRADDHVHRKPDSALPERLRLAADRGHAAEADDLQFRSQLSERARAADRKSTRLNSSHRTISYAVFCLKKKKKKNNHINYKKKKKKKTKKK